MRVAVLMSTYNGEKYVQEQIESILNQKGDFELDLWVRDDGSNDLTQKILENYAFEGKLRWYTGENIGPAQSFMNLLMNCVGYECYAFADQDDYWLPDKIQSGILAIRNMDGPTLYCSNAELVDFNLNSIGRSAYLIPPKIDFYTLTCAGGLLGCTMLFNNSLAFLVQERTLPTKIVMHDFYMTVLCTAVGGKIIYDEKSHIKYRQHENNVVGVSVGFLNKIRNRLLAVTHKNKICISEQANSILLIYKNEIEYEKKKWLEKVSKYQNSIMNKVKLAFSRKTIYSSKNAAFKLRLEIILGNR